MKNPVYVGADDFGMQLSDGYFDLLYMTSDLSDADIAYIKDHSGRYTALTNELNAEVNKEGTPDRTKVIRLLDAIDKELNQYKGKSEIEISEMLNRALEKDLQHLGYDGIVYNNNEGDGLSYAVFDNSQIKQIDKNYNPDTSRDVSNSLPENKKTKAKKEKSTPENKITDFGEKSAVQEKICGKTVAWMLETLGGMTEKEKAKFITKDNIWKKPNYEALIKEGKDKNVTYFMKPVRDTLPTKPEFRATNKDLAQRVQEEYVKQMREITDRVVQL